LGRWWSPDRLNHRADRREEMTDPTPRDVDAYIGAAPEAARPILRQLRLAIKTAVPDAEEKISYGMPHYSYRGRLAYFAAHKRHVGLYALGPSDSFPPELMQYAAAKGTLQFPIGQALPAAAIGRLVKARAREKDAKLAHDAGPGSAR
jgi:uncharacterized protein YdhG (YjbR/CyaY superfamily)